MMALNQRYGLEMKPETVPEICAKYGLWHPMLEMTAA
jgi:hypothetical protein